jgi:uncharacterized glyoxalase superfamily protein PhnB
MTDEFTDVIPLLACSDIEAEHDYLLAAMGFVSGGVERTEAGTVVHAEVRAGTRRIWLHRADEATGLGPPGTRGTASGGMVIHVADVDAHHQRAMAAGAQILYPPRDEGYGQREYGLRDPEGHSWWIATPIKAPQSG